MFADKRILIAEDDYVASMLLEFNLKKCGFDVISARDGEHAWQVLQQEAANLVITDQQMPGMSGLELCSRIRNHSRTQNVPVILITCKAWEFDAEALKESLDVAAVLEKPFSPRNLFALIENILFPDEGNRGVPPVFVDLPSTVPVSL